MSLKTGLLIDLVYDHEDDVYYQVDDVGGFLYDSETDYVALCGEKVAEVLDYEEDTLTLHLVFEPTPSYVHVLVDEDYDLIIEDGVFDVAGASRMWLRDRALKEFWVRVVDDSSREEER